MFIGPKPKAPIPKTKTVPIALLLLFLIYQVWVQHDNLTFEAFTATTAAAGAAGRIVSSLTTSSAPLDNNNKQQQQQQQTGFPKKIWYKLGPKGLSEQIEAWTSTCIDQNPDYEYEFLTDATAEEYVIRTFSADRPDIVDVYTQLTVPILKADLLRYLLLYTEGGVWSDLDVSCEEGIPISEWIPEPYRSAPTDGGGDNNKVDLVVGYEFDAGFSDFYFHEFATWTILSKPRVSHMLVVIDDIIESVYIAQANNKVDSLGDLTPVMVGDIVDFTGPRRFTRSVLQSVTDTLDRSIDRHGIENILEPVLLDNVLILPGNAFSNATNHFEDLGESSVPVLVTHHYAGSWKNEYGGERVEEEEERPELPETDLV